MQRVRSFDTPHKGIRKQMSSFSNLAGSIDYSNAADLDKLRLSGQELFAMLNLHMHTENEILLKALEARCPGAAQHDLSDHEEIEVMQTEIETALNNLRAETAAGQSHDFYLMFSRFHSHYLQHIYDEETLTEKLLWENFTDEELLVIRGQILSRFSPDELLLSLKIIVPAQSEKERLQLLGAFRKNAPEAVFSRVMKMLRTELSETESGLLEQKLLNKSVTIDN